MSFKDMWQARYPGAYYHVMDAYKTSTTTQEYILPGGSVAWSFIIKLSTLAITCCARAGSFFLLTQVAQRLLSLQA